MSNKKAIRLIKYTFTIIGLAALIGSIILYFHTRDFTAQAQHAEGEVIELSLSISESSDDRTIHHYRPVVRFYPHNSETAITFINNVGSNPPAYQVGEHVPVLYLPDSPQQARINSFISLWLVILILFFLGLIFSVIGLGLFYLDMRRLRQHLKTK